MTPDRTESIFAAAIVLPMDEQAAYLDQACTGDAVLREHVEALLRAHDRAGHLLDRPVPAELEQTWHYAADEQPGAVIAGRHKLLEAIGEGGMGTVWVAEQLEPVRRKVALKQIKAGMDSRSVIARFEAERQALAMMDHPNVAKVLDGGLTESGRPFFVMEYVKGVPITEYCDAMRLSVSERLQLFTQVCQAVQHAHQKGIIHRDLKPSNILVAPYDDKPVPKIIDFGLAKAMHQSLTEKTLHTAHESVLGTPLYMSPEQAQLNNLDVDTRSDIYSLGVILYELLTGTTPLEKRQFQQAAWHEMLRLIKEEEPPRPSVRLSGSGALPTLAAQRQLEPIKLTKLVRGELDWIVMKCLEKDRSRRYDTANGLARDLERYLADEVVEARPVSAGYRLRKFVRKHRVAISTGAAFAVLLIGGAVISGCLAVQARRAEGVAEDRRQEAEAETRRADRNAAMLAGAITASDENRRNVELTATSLQIDLDLTEIQEDKKVGLLQLCRTLKGIPTGPQVRKIETEFIGLVELKNDEADARLREFREFVTAAILATGQDYAQLLPSISHDGQAVAIHAISADHQTLLTLGKDYTARLWDTRTVKPIAVLRQGDEQVVNCGFSPDGRTVFTDDLSSVARFWDARSGRFRAATPARPSRYDAKFTPVDVGPGVWTDNPPQNSALISNDRLLTQRSVGESESPVELWDTATGRLVAGLDGPNRPNHRFKFLSTGRWVTTTEGHSTVLVFSADDGRLVGRLEQPAGETLHDMTGSPSGRRLAMVSTNAAGEPLIRIWDANSWKAESAPVPIKADGSGIGLGSHFQFWTEDLIAFAGVVDVDGRVWDVYRRGQAEPITQWMIASLLLPPVDDLVRLSDGRVFDSGTWKRLFPPAGRKFHPNLARFALDGRFVTTYPGGLLIDTLTDKRVGTLAGEGWISQPGWNSTTPFGNLPGFGLVAASNRNGGLVDLRLLPAASRLNLPADLLELWSQVAVCGETGPDGQFVKWDESSWERKRHELAARPAPDPDFPFPGQLATDQLHWLRSEFSSAIAETEKLRLATELVRRAEATGNQAETIRWRAEKARFSPKIAVPAQPE